MPDLTHILTQMRDGDTRAPAQLAEMLYDQLKAMAGRAMEGERVDHTLQPTALANEAYMRLVSREDANFENRAHFLGAAAISIRRVLVEHARRRARMKRGGDHDRLDFESIDIAAKTNTVTDEALIDLDDALRKLEALSPSQARLVEQRFFSGLTVPETASIRGVSESTIQREWRLVRAWLKGELEGRDGS